MLELNLFYWTALLLKCTDFSCSKPLRLSIRVHTLHMWSYTLWWWCVGISSDSFVQGPLDLRVLKMILYICDPWVLWSNTCNLFCLRENSDRLTLTELDMLVIKVLLYIYQPASLCNWCWNGKKDRKPDWFHTMHMWWYAGAWDVEAHLSSLFFCCRVLLMTVQRRNMPRSWSRLQIKLLH